MKFRTIFVFAKIISIFVHHKDSFSKCNLFLNILLSIGDEVIVTSTDYDMEQTERRSLVDCPECSANQIKVDRKYDIMLMYMYLNALKHSP